MSTDGPIDYIPRTRFYYEALGYERPYEWAHFENVPFTRLVKPLSACRIAIVTTAAPYQPGKGDQGPGAPYNASAKFYHVYAGETASDPDLRISHVSIDRAHTTAEDQNSYFPLPALRRAAKRVRIAGVTPHFFGLPTNRSQRRTMEVDCPDLVSRVKADKADAAIFVPNCPVCHQSVALAARALEEAGIATVIMGCAKDIVERVGVPRFVFSDFPLGNAAGKPNDMPSQDMTLQFALELLEQATTPRATRVSSLAWSPEHHWKVDYCNAALLSAEEIAQRRQAFDAAKAEAKTMRENGNFIDFLASTK